MFGEIVMAYLLLISNLQFQKYHPQRLKIVFYFRYQVVRNLMPLCSTTKILCHSYRLKHAFQGMLRYDKAMMYAIVSPAEYLGPHAPTSQIRSLNAKNITLFLLLRTSISVDMSVRWLCDVRRYRSCRTPQQARRGLGHELLQVLETCFLSLMMTSSRHPSFVSRQGSGLQISLFQFVRQCS